MATDEQPNGWSVYEGVNIGDNYMYVPPTAQIADNYRVCHFRRGMPGIAGFYTRYFDVRQPRWTVMNLSNGLELQGDVAVDVTLYDPTMEHGNLILSLDGEDLACGGQPEGGIGRLFASIQIPTDTFTNGAHTIRIRDDQANERSYLVYFANEISNIEVSSLYESAAPPGSPDQCHIQATMGSVQPWTVVISNLADVPVRTYTGTSAEIDLLWDGRDDAGAPVEDSVCDVAFDSGQPGGQPRRRLTNRKRIGDALILLDEAVFPNRDQSGSLSINGYARFIAARLLPYIIDGTLTHVSIVTTNGIELMREGRGKPNWVGKKLQLILDHFAQRLHVFYVDSHGGIGGGKPFFAIGAFGWYLGQPTGRTPFEYNVASLVAPVSYGQFTDPPALVWIDSCKSFGGNLDGTPAPGQDSSWAQVFASGQLGYGAAIGWNGNCVFYGAWAPPNDCWTFWRNQLWVELTSGRNFQTAVSHADTNTTAHGFGRFNFGERPNDRKSWSGAGITSL